MAFRGLVFAVCAMAAVVMAHPSQAQDTGDTRLVFVDSDPASGRPGPVDGSLSVLQFPALPPVEAAKDQVLAALLRSNPVSTFLASPGEITAQTDALYIVMNLSLAEASGTEGAQQDAMVQVGPDRMEMSTLHSRFDALISALNPAARQIAFLHVDDPDNRLPAMIDAFRSGLKATGLGMTVIMVNARKDECAGDRPPLEYAVLGGLADRAPFGDDDGRTDAAEASAWISRALARNAERGHPCAAGYSLILRGDDASDRVLIDHGDKPLIPALDSAVYLESFEALFLRGAEKAGPIRDYLESCTYCPHERELSNRMRDIAEHQLALELETDIWNRIREDETPDRYEVYLDNCRLCTYRDEAEARLARIAEIRAARDAEKAAFDRLAAARDLNGLRDWLETCVACDQRAQAETLLDDILSDERLQEENEALKAALRAKNAERIRGWLETCDLCAAQDEARAGLARMQEEAEAARPCQRAAGLPQNGGPRLLAAIDTDAARATCRAITARYPNSPVAITTLGRVAQAEGDAEAARAAYATGIEAGLPQAYGLGAYLAFSPGGDRNPDYAKAERLARDGYERGDWLSGEVLTLIYLRELVEGRSATDALPIARAQAADGNPVAQFFMGYFHNTGTAVEKSVTRAADWFTRAVDQGYLHANSFLAGILERGAEGTPADVERATELYWQALAAGDSTARQRLTDQIDDRPADVVRGIQARLRDEGIFNGLVDGIAGPRTAGAVARFASLQDQEQD
ncbi:MAG: hypothetical protein RI571_11505 [Roseovarius sp.]|nr:hypothetical protein [Roseovarius sp.]